MTFYESIWGLTFKKLLANSLMFCIGNNCKSFLTGFCGGVWLDFRVHLLRCKISYTYFKIAGGKLFLCQSGFNFILSIFIWMIFRCILRNFYPYFYQFLTVFWPLFAVSRLIFGSFGANFWQYFDLFLAIFWPFFGSVLTYLWQYSDLSLAVFWLIFGSILTYFWQYFDQFLAVFWPIFGSILTNFWQYFDQFLAAF